MTSGIVRPSTAVVLVAHGSDRSPAVAALVRRQAEQLAAWGIGDEVTAAYLRAEPRVEQVLDRLEAARVVVVPLLTSEGYYTRDVLPQALRANQRFESVRLHVTPPIGRHRGLESLVARRVRRFLASGAPDATLLVVGHGTVRHPNSRAATERFAAGVARRVGRPARTAFLDDTPRLEEVWLETPARPVIVVPFLLGGGAHASQDIMERLGIETGIAAQWVQAAGRPVLVDWPVGTLDGVVDLVAEWAVKGLARIVDREADAHTRRGRVFLVGAGPGDPGLLTVRGRALLRRADVVIHDRLIDPRVLGQARPEALIVDVGKTPGGPRTAQERINALLVEHARQGRVVVRLKGGDPFIFGRGSEEQDACAAAGIRCRVVSGVTSAIAVPAAAGIPVTRRGVAQSFAVVTAEVAVGESSTLDWAEGLVGADTVVVLMGRTALARVASRLVAAGRSPETPVACVQSGTLPSQRVVRGTLATIAREVEEAGLSSPMVTVVGAVAALGNPRLAAALPAAGAAPC